MRTARSALLLSWSVQRRNGVAKVDLEFSNQIHSLKSTTLPPFSFHFSEEEKKANSPRGMAVLSPELESPATRGGPTFSPSLGPRPMILGMMFAP